MPRNICRYSRLLTAIVIFTLCLPVSGLAAADFTGSPLSGEAPLTVNFTDLSGEEATQWSWDFNNDGTPDSAARNPSHTYTQAGTYTVSLTVTGPDGEETETKTDFITVLEPAPVAGFSASPTSGTKPLSVNFSDLSTGTVTGWSWDFDSDGQADSFEQNPSHTYTEAGIYSVRLTVTGPGGSDVEEKSAYITVAEPPPVSDFSVDETDGAKPLTVQFMDLSQGAITAWSWDFNSDGQPDSAEQNPAYTFSEAGTHTVALTVTGPGGTDSETKTGYITVTEPPPTADFSANTINGLKPLVVEFSDGSTGAVTEWSWDFDSDGQPDSTEQSPAYTYSEAGTYTVTLTVTGPGGTDSEIKTGYISVTEPPPTADFSSDTTSGNKPLTVNFNDLSTGAVTDWSWDFNNDGQPDSAEQNPAHTFSEAGTYTVALTATGPGGTGIETKTGYISVTEPPPAADFSVSTTSGLKPLVVEFSDGSIGAVTEWSWDFDSDGQSDSTEQNPVYTFSEAGTYTITLTVTGPGGSGSETKTGYISVIEPPPTAGFSVNAASGLKPLAVEFSDNSTGAVTGWSWDFDNDGVVDSVEQNPSYTYGRAGIYTVSLTVSGPGGAGTETKTDYIEVIDVITLQWDANSEEDLAGYYIYYKVGSIENLDSYGDNYEEFDGTGALEGDSPIKVPLEVLEDPDYPAGDPDHPAFRLTGLSTDQYYYFFAVTAYNDKEPEQQSKLSIPIGTFFITPPGSIEEYQDDYVNSSRADNYNIYGGGIPGAAVEVFAGDVPLGGTTIDKDGHWVVQAVYFSAVPQGDAELTAISNGTVSYPVKITHDTGAPQVAVFPTVIKQGDTYAIVYWETDEPGTSTVVYGHDAAHTFSRADEQYATRHFIMLDDLVPETKYHFHVSSTDAAGNTVIEGAKVPVPASEYAFTTLAPTPPTVVGTPYIGFDYILITFDKPNMQNADIEANYSFSPALNFDSPGIYGEFYDVTNFTGASYYLSMLSIPTYEIFTLTVSGITDYAGQPVTPDTIRINDNDGDGMADDWEFDFGLDPSNPADGYAFADADNDGYSNYKEYMARTDPQSAASIPFVLKDILPPDRAGVDTENGVPVDAGFAVLIGSVNGIDPDGDPDSVRFVIDDGENIYERKADSDMVRVIEISEDENGALKNYWLTYDRSLESELSQTYAYDSPLTIWLEVYDNLKTRMNTGNYTFRTETADAYGERTDPVNLPDIEMVEATDSDLGGIFDSGVKISSGRLTGAKILFNSDETFTPTFGTIYTIPDVDITDVQGVGLPLNLQPSTVFDYPVKLIIPFPGSRNVSDLDLYMYDGAEWRPACDADGNVLPGGEGWMVPGSRVNHDDYDPATVELQVYHFSAVQGGTVVIGFESSNGNTVIAGGGSCFVEALNNSGDFYLLAAAVFGVVLALVAVLVKRKMRVH